MKASLYRRTQRLSLVISFLPYHVIQPLQRIVHYVRRVSSLPFSKRFADLLRLLVAFNLLTTASAGWAATQDMREITSELIYNFALLSQTPNRIIQEAYNICAFEEDIIYLQATTLESQRIQNVPVFLVPVKANADVKRCNLLYIQAYVPQRPLELQQSIQKDVVLTVVHAPNKFTEHGHVVINAQDKRYQFDLRIQPAKQAGIVFDARLLKLATNIIND